MKKRPEKHPYRCDSGHAMHPMNWNTSNTNDRVPRIPGVIICTPPLRIIWLMRLSITFRQEDPSSDEWVGSIRLDVAFRSLIYSNHRHYHTRHYRRFVAISRGRCWIFALVVTRCVSGVQPCYRLHRKPEKLRECLGQSVGAACHHSTHGQKRAKIGIVSL